MFSIFNKFFSKKNINEQSDNHSLNNSIYRLIFEIIAADHIIKDEEINITAELLKKYFNYDEKQTTVELIKLKDENFFNSDLTKITLELKSTLSYAERVNIIKICWKVLLIDSDQDVLETATVRKISILLGIEDRDFISIRNKIKSSQ
jgi:uncharacterized tellurite resistance protein B-like protein